MHCYYHSLWPRVTPSLHILSVPFTPRAQSWSLSCLCLEFVSTGSCPLQIDLVQWFSAVPTQVDWQICRLNHSAVSDTWPNTSCCSLVIRGSFPSAQLVHLSEPVRLPIMRRDLQKTLPLLWEAQQRLGSVWRRWKSFYLLTSAAKGLKKACSEIFRIPLGPDADFASPQCRNASANENRTKLIIQLRQEDKSDRGDDRLKKCIHPRGAI